MLQSILLLLVYGGFDLPISSEIIVSELISNPIHIRRRLELSIVAMGPEKMVN